MEQSHWCHWADAGVKLACVPGEIGKSWLLGGTAAELTDEMELLQLSHTPLQAWLGSGGWPGFL